MKKILVLMLCIAALGVSGCGKKQDGNNSEQPTQTPAVVENGAMGVSMDGEKVKINMPAAIFGDDVEKSANETKEIRGFENAEVQADGSVTFTMTQEQQNKWVLETYENSKKSANEFIQNNFISLKEVELSEDFKSAAVKTNKASYKSETDKVAAQGIANFLFTCQSMSGVKKEELKVTVNFVDADSNEVIETVEILGNN